jgi:hypothetical protein
MAGFLLEEAHHDDIALGSGGRTAIASHDCGAHEIHVPLDNLHPCLACFLTSQRVTTPALPLIPDAEIFLCLSVIPVLDQQLPSTDYLFTGKRGPPMS